ncbi:MAG: flavin reductase family protein [Planctomycetaceae bacterium]|jgi:flavin reductase (DIM6/NTAB) family NADH-FMN oxidoreductase RutF|nr:flavin reductase family protein [bacterium]MDC0273123.1 flavin reductase family protein [Planctomycetaceae bacterium]MDG2387821.1 flavin reductase family protein [Planctomycetaceae bacterium]
MTDSVLTDEQRNQIAPILGKTPSGVFILTATDGEGNETGMLASWVQQAAFEPPIISVAVNTKRYINEWLQRTQIAAVSLVGKSNSGTFFKQFGKGFDPGVPAFERIEITRGTTGVPLLADAFGSLEGKITHHCEAGDHTIFFLQIENAVTGSAFDADEPYVHIRKNGFSY